MCGAGPGSFSECHKKGKVGLHWLPAAICMGGMHPTRAAAGAASRAARAAAFLFIPDDAAHGQKDRGGKDKQDKDCRQIEHLESVSFP